MSTKTIKAIVGLLLLIQSPTVISEDTPAADYTVLSCAELYAMASALEPQTQNIRSPLFNEKTNAVATAIGAVTNVGYYYFGFTTAHGFYQEYKAHIQLANLDQVRQLMAQRFCFQKS